MDTNIYIDNMTTTFKVAFEIGGEVEFRYLNIKKSCESSTLYLYSKLQQEFSCLNANQPNFKIYWQDFEGDDICISSDETLAFALKSMPDIKKFRVVYTDESNTGDHIAKEFQGYFTSTRKRGSICRTQHVGIVCDSCNGEIFGYRYKCLICPDFDLCQKCELQSKHSAHYMLRIPKPVRSMPCDLKGSKLGEWMSTHVKKSSKDEGNDFSYGKKHCKGKSGERERRCRYSFNLSPNQVNANGLYQKLGEYFNEFTNLAGELKIMNEEEARDAWSKAKATKKQATTESNNKENASTSQSEQIETDSTAPKNDSIEADVVISQPEPIIMEAISIQNQSNVKGDAKLIKSKIDSIIDNIMDVSLQCKLPPPVDATPVENQASASKVSGGPVMIEDCSDDSSDDSNTTRIENEWTMLNSEESSETVVKDKEDMDTIVDAFRKQMEVCEQEVKVIQENIQNKETRFVLLDSPQVTSPTPIEADPPKDNPPNNTNTTPSAEASAFAFSAPAPNFSAAGPAPNFSAAGPAPNFTATGPAPVSDIPQPMFGFCPPMPNYASPQFPPPLPTQVHNPTVFVTSNQVHHPMQTPYNNTIYPNNTNVTYHHPIGVGFAPGYIPVIPRGNFVPARVVPLSEPMRPTTVPVTVPNPHIYVPPVTGARNPKQTPSRDTSRITTAPTLFPEVAPQPSAQANVNPAPTFLQSVDRMVRDAIGTVRSNETPAVPTPTNTTDDTARTRFPRNARIAEVLRKMIDMGYSNQNDMLLNILENLDGDINATIDFLSTQK